MNLEARKTAFIQEFLRLQNEEIIGRLENFLSKQKAELDDDYFKPMTMEEYEARIDEAMEASKNGQMTKASDLLEEIKTWS